MRDVIEKMNSDVDTNYPKDGEKVSTPLPHREFGRITFYHDEREFGFIKPDSGDEDVWFHASRVTGFGRLYKDRPVSFILSIAEGGRRRAREVWVE